MAELAAQLQSLQADFRETHKELERVTAAAADASGAQFGGVNGGDRANLPSDGMAPLPSVADLKREVSQLEEERGQLLDKITGMKRKTADMVS